MSEWNTTTFDELIRAGVLVLSDGYRAKNDELGGEGLIFLRAGHVRDSHIDFDGVERFRELDDSRFETKVSRAGDVVVTTKGNSTGRATYISENMPRFVYSPHLSFWRSIKTEALDSSFLRAWSRGPEFTAQLRGMSTSTDMAPYLSLIDQRRMSISLPSIALQRAIGGILGALDDKIELNRQMNATLEALARALFQSWFVDFDPVRAKMRGEQPAGMDAATAALFPSRLVQTEHGEVPEGWTTREIGQAVTVVGGSTPSTERADFWDGPHAWVRPKDLSNLSTPVLLNTERTITDAGLATISSKLLPINSVLLSSRAPIGYLAINRIPVAINQGFIGMICDGPLPPNYVLRWTESQLETIKGRAGGTTFPEISKGAFRPLPVLVPTSDAVSAFERRAAPLMERLAGNEMESATLAATRDLLLPRLLSGELRVPDAERLVAEAV